MLAQTYYSWALKGEFLAECDRVEKKTAGGIILPPSMSTVVDDRPALIHFSRLDNTGEEHTWLWLFHTPKEAIALRELPQYVNTADTELISTTLPKGPGHLPQPCYLQSLPTDFWGLVDLAEVGIEEVWLGFDWRVYLNDLSLRSTVKTIVPAAEFQAILRR